MSGRIALRDALGNHAKRVVDRHQAIRRANVVDTSPLTVDVFGYDIPLTLDDDFELSQSMVLYQSAVGFQVDDLVLMHQEQDDWTLLDVVSDADVTSGMQKKMRTPSKPSFITFTSQRLYGANWSDYGTFARGGYAVDALGFCTVRGLVKKSTAYSNGETIATLPVIPSDGPEIFNAKAADSVMGAFVTRVDVGGDGKVTLVSGDATPNYSTPGSMAYLSLSGIRFQVA